MSTTTGTQNSYYSTTVPVRSVFDGHYSDLFENYFQTVPTDTTLYRSPGRFFNNSHGPIEILAMQQVMVDPPPLAVHEANVFLLDTAAEARSFADRAQLLYHNWNVLHFFSNVDQLRALIAQLHPDSHFLLLELSIIVPLSVVTIEYILVRTLGQWVQYFALHNVVMSDVLDISPLLNTITFAALHSTVHPCYNVCIASIIELVNFASNAYRFPAVIQLLLYRQMSKPTQLDALQLNVTTADANILLASYFPGEYICND